MIGLIISAFAALNAKAFDGQLIVSVEEQPGFLYRQAQGPKNVVDLDSLVRDFDEQLITEQDLINQLEEEQAGLIQSLLAKYNGVVTTCMLNELRIAQSNGVIRVESTGLLVFFEWDEYLDEYGQVLSGEATKYNETIRANKILQKAMNAWSAAGCYGPAKNNRCCKCAPLCNCSTVMDGGSCEMNPNGNCEHGSTNCS